VSPVLPPSPRPLLLKPLNPNFDNLETVLEIINSQNVATSSSSPYSWLYRHDSLRPAAGFSCCTSEPRPGAGSSSNTITGETGCTGSRAMYRQRFFHRFALHALHRVCGGHIHGNTVFRATGCPVKRLQWKASRGIVGHRWNCFEHQLHLAVRYGLR